MSMSTSLITKSHIYITALQFLQRTIGSSHGNWNGSYHSDKNPNKLSSSSNDIRRLYHSYRRARLDPDDSSPSFDTDISKLLNQGEQPKLTSAESSTNATPRKLRWESWSQEAGPRSSAPIRNNPLHCEEILKEHSFSGMPTKVVPLTTRIPTSLPPPSPPLLPPSPSPPTSLYPYRNINNDTIGKLQPFTLQIAPIRMGETEARSRRCLRSFEGCAEDSKKVSISSSSTNRVMVARSYPSPQIEGKSEARGSKAPLIQRDPWHSFEGGHTHPFGVRTTNTRKSKCSKPVNANSPSKAPATQISARRNTENESNTALESTSSNNPVTIRALHNQDTLERGRVSKATLIRNDPRGGIEDCSTNLPTCSKSHEGSNSKQDNAHSSLDSRSTMIVAVTFRDTQKYPSGKDQELKKNKAPDQKAKQLCANKSPVPSSKVDISAVSHCRLTYNSNKPCNELARDHTPPKINKERRGKKHEIENGKPKRFRSAYVLFTKEWIPKLWREIPNLTFVESGKLLGEKWAALTPKEKETYDTMAAKDKARYQKEMKDYKRRKGVKEIKMCAKDAGKNPSASQSDVSDQKAQASLPTSTPTSSASESPSIDPILQIPLHVTPIRKHLCHSSNVYDKNADAISANEPLATFQVPYTCPKEVKNQVPENLTPKTKIPSRKGIVEDINALKRISGLSDPLPDPSLRIDCIEDAAVSVVTPSRRDLGFASRSDATSLRSAFLNHVRKVKREMDQKNNLGQRKSTSRNPVPIPDPHSDRAKQLVVSTSKPIRGDRTGEAPRSAVWKHSKKVECESEEWDFL